MSLGIIVLYNFWLASLNFVPGGSQAPGDQDSRCRSGQHAQNKMFPAEWRILVDTYDYSNLYLEPTFVTPVWEARSLDGDTLTWQGDLGGTCTESMRACTRSTSQNNWLFSQHVRYVDAKEVFFKVTYRFTECSPPSCTKNYMTLYHYNRDSVDSASTDRINPNNYRPLLGDTTTSRLVQGPANADTEKTLAIRRPANSLGFYLGVNDEGTCGQVNRIIVYYVACPSSVSGLVTYPETGVPVRSGSDEIFDAQCASNAHNTTTLQVIASASTSTCSPVAPGGARCECNPGYLISSDGASCGACAAGTYRADGGSSCLGCPTNTMTGAVAAAQCNCRAGFFRAPQEGPEIQCTEPPTACTNLRVTSRAATTITVSWDRPATIGRNDFFYQIFVSDPQNIGVFVERENLTNSGSSVTYQVTGLIPFTSYIIRITTHNGVSDQDPQGASSRQVEVTTMTMEGVPGIPSAVQRLCTTIVWQAPTSPNGVITRYQLRFSSDTQQILSRAANVNFLVTDNEQQGTGVTVQVRAETSAGFGEWTPAALVCPVPCMMDLTSTAQTRDTISVAWNRPDMISGDITYSIAISERDSGDGTFRTVDGRITDTGASLTYTLTGLTTFTSYSVKLTANSSNPSEDPDVCKIVVSTAEGVSSPPTQFAGSCEILVWGPPAEPNGILVSYNIEFRTNSGTMAPILIGPQDSHYNVTDSELRSAGVTARIRANTGSGNGMWTSYIPNGCSPDICTRDNESSALFADSNGVELAIVAVCTFAVTLVVLILVFVMIGICIKRNNHLEKGSNSNSHEMKDWRS